MGINWLDTILVSISMAVDCMTVGATDGIEEPHMKKQKTFFIAFIFGLFQFMMPTIGYFIFYFIVNYGLNKDVQEQLETFIPWIAFSLLTLLGIKNIIEWFKERKEAKEGKEASAPKELTIGGILVQGIATSIDALCIGFVYSPLEYGIPAALTVFGVIGGVTCLLSVLTILFGKVIGDKLEKWAGLIAGVVFIAIGLKILLEGIL